MKYRNLLNETSGNFILMLSIVIVLGALTIYYSQSFLLSKSSAIEITESFENNLVQGNYVYHGNNAKFSHVDDISQANDGKRALKIESTNSKPATNSIDELTRWMTGIDKHKVIPGEKVTASVYMKASNVKDRGVLAISYFKDKGSGSWGDAWISTATSSGRVSGNDDWTRIALGSDVPAGAVYARFEFRLFDSGTIWIDDFSIRDTGTEIDLGNKGNSKVRVFEDPNNNGDNSGAQVVLNETHFTWVNSACKEKLIADGNTLEKATWTELNAKYKQIKTNSLDCSEIRAFTTYEEAKERIEKEEPGPSEVISSDPPSMPNPDPLVYTGPNQFDTSVIPEDEVVTTTLHGRFNGKGQQLFTVDCKSSHFDNVDPIVFPNELGASHNHEFFGDESLGAFSTVESIIGNAANTCEVGADRSAYWTPTAFQDGKRLVADNNKFYYKIGRVNPQDIIPMPVGLRMIAGNANATGPQSPQVTYLFATTSEGKHTEPHTQSTHGGAMFTTNSRENGVRLQIQFPQCWDGVNLWLPNSKHMAYPVGNKCPDTHPKAFFQLMFNLGYTDATGGNGFRFSSGPWYTAHADFINGWKPETLERLVETCVRGQRYCGLTKSDSKACAGRPSLSRSGCIEFRAGETEPRFFGKNY